MLIIPLRTGPGQSTNSSEQCCRAGPLARPQDGQVCRAGGAWKRGKTYMGSTGEKPVEEKGGARPRG